MEHRDSGLIYFMDYKDHDGTLVAITGQEDVPFDIERVFYIYGVPETYSRAGHGHKETEQVLIAISGSFYASINNNTFYLLNTKQTGLYVSPGDILNLYGFSDDCVCLVLASKKYSVSDYIHEESHDSIVLRFNAISTN